MRTKNGTLAGNGLKSKLLKFGILESNRNVKKYFALFNTWPRVQFFTEFVKNYSQITQQGWVYRTRKAFQ